MNKNQKPSYNTIRLTLKDSAYPAILLARLGEMASETLIAVGPVEVLLCQWEAISYNLNGLGG